MKLLATFGFILALVLTGCDTFYGPVLQNGRTVPIEVTAYFADGGNSTSRLNPGQALWQRTRGRVLDRIVVSQNGSNIEFGGDVVHAVLARAPSADNAVLLIGNAGLNITSVAEAKRRQK